MCVHSSRCRPFSLYTLIAKANNKTTGTHKKYLYSTSNSKEYLSWGIVRTLLHFNAIKAQL